MASRPRPTPGRSARCAPSRRSAVWGRVAGARRGVRRAHGGRARRAGLRRGDRRGGRRRGRHRLHGHLRVGADPARRVGEARHARQPRRAPASPGPVEVDHDLVVRSRFIADSREGVAAPGRRVPRGQGGRADRRRPHRRRDRPGAERRRTWAASRRTRSPSTSPSATSCRISPRPGRCTPARIRFPGAPSPTHGVVARSAPTRYGRSRSVGPRPVAHRAP